MAKSKLDEFRAATLGKTRVFEKEIIEIDGVKFEVRQPTIASRGAINNKAMAFVDDNGNPLDKPKFETAKFQIYAVIHMTFIPGTDEKVFTEADFEALCEQPAGGWFSEFADVAGRLANPDADEVKKPSDEMDEKE